MRPERNKLNIQTASKIAENYCVKNRLSIQKLQTQRVMAIGDSVIFAQPVQHTSVRIGLASDKATQPKPTLVLRRTGTGYDVEETEYTKNYLK